MRTKKRWWQFTREGLKGTIAGTFVATSIITTMLAGGGEFTGLPEGVSAFVLSWSCCNLATWLYDEKPLRRRKVTDEDIKDLLDSDSGSGSGAGGQ